MSQANNQVPTYLEHLSAMRGNFEKIAPPTLNWIAERGYALQILEGNKQLMQVAIDNPVSLAQAIRNLAAMGLSLNPAKKEAYLLSRNIKVGQNQWVSAICVEPSYMGLCNVATRSGRIQWIQANCVYAQDAFIDNGPGERPTHTYNAFAKDRGAFVGVYSVAKTAEGDYLTTIMTVDEINTIKDRSETGKKGVGPWKTDYLEQAKKTVVRRQFKMLPKAGDLEGLANAVNLSNENEGFEPITSNPVEQATFTGEQKTHFDSLLSSSDSLGLFAFEQTFGRANPRAWVNLYHSFEPRTKGRNQQLVDRMLTEGRTQFGCLVDSFNAAAECDDRGALAQIVEELRPDELALLLDRASNEARAWYREGRQE